MTRSRISEYRDSFVAYLDILGWKSVVARIGTEFDRFDDILAAFSTLESHSQEDTYVRKMVQAGNQLVNLPPPQHLVASDTIILSTTTDGNAMLPLLIRCGKICADLLDRGFLTRGAIVRGPLYHKDRVIFGRALTDAHVMERAHARYPRVIVTEDVYNHLTQAGPLRGGFAEATYRNMFNRDQDGFWRLNPFANLFVPSRGSMATYFENAADAIVRTLSEFPPGSGEFAKGWWLGEVHNSELAREQDLEPDRVRGVEPIDLQTFLFPR